MLIANLNDISIEALRAARGHEYRCPNCKCLMVLKQGRTVIHHFAHKPTLSCEWGSGETYAHLQAKLFLRDALRARGLRAEVEYVVDTLPGDRRADVMTWRADNQMVAFELQHTAISLDEIEARAKSYARIGIAQIWIPFLSPQAVDRADDSEVGLFVKRYSPRPFEKWVHGLNGKEGMWMYNPRAQHFWRGHLRPHQLYVEETNWSGEGGEEMSSGGFLRNSKRYRDLDLIGPCEIATLKIALTRRQRWEESGYHWPAGKIARFVEC